MQAVQCKVSALLSSRSRTLTPTATSSGGSSGSSSSSSGGSTTATTMTVYYYMVKGVGCSLVI